MIDYDDDDDGTVVEEVEVVVDDWTRRTSWRLEAD
jgi:hypothetical protein